MRVDSTVFSALDRGVGTYAKFTLLGAALLVSALAWGTHVVRHRWIS